MTISSYGAQNNYLLRTLPHEEWQRLYPHLEAVSLSLGQVLHEPGVPLRYVYFPTTCIVSLLGIMADGATAESGVVGREGMVGVATFMSGEAPSNRAVVQGAGYAYRLRSQVLREAFQRCATLQQNLLRYTQALLTQMTQTAVCNRYHSVDQQLCRWLLGNLDRQSSNDLSITQELIAHMLGVRREGITMAAGKLKRAGVIQCRRGGITVTQREQLEARACECYGIVRREFERLLPGAAADTEHAEVHTAAAGMA